MGRLITPQLAQGQRQKDRSTIRRPAAGSAWPSGAASPTSSLRSMHLHDASKIGLGAFNHLHPRVAGERAEPSRRHRRPDMATTTRVGSAIDSHFMRHGVSRRERAFYGRTCSCTIDLARTRAGCAWVEADVPSSGSEKHIRRSARRRYLHGSACRRRTVSAKACPSRSRTPALRLIRLVHRRRRKYRHLRSANTLHPDPP